MSLNVKSLDDIFLFIRKKPEKEYRFHPTRKWRFDFAYPDLKIAFEYEGIFSVKSRHTSITGFSNDCDKYNEAQWLGWKVYRFTAIMLKNGKALDMIVRALNL